MHEFTFDSCFARDVDSDLIAEKTYQPGLTCYISVVFPDSNIVYPKNATRADPGGRSLPLKPTKVTFFTMILCNSENSVRDIRPFCRQLFCHRSVVKYTSSLLQ